MIMAFQVTTIACFEFVGVPQPAMAAFLRNELALAQLVDWRENTKRTESLLSMMPRLFRPSSFDSVLPK